MFSVSLLLVVLLIASFFIANIIAWFVQVRRARRIHEKTLSLAKTEPLITSPSTKSKRSEAKEEEEEEEGEEKEIRRIPVTILTGFLGAGKTTLLNRILHTPNLPYKVMVLENEIGTISIDHAILKPDASGKNTSEGIYVLENGCMCCTARGSSRKSSGELERILDYLLRIVHEEGFDYVLVETTGLADPGPIIETFLQLRASRFRLDSVFSMVDTHAAQRFWSMEDKTFHFPIELQRQLLYADTIALNKMDLMQENSQQVTRLLNHINQLNEEAKVIQCTDAQVELKRVLGINTFDAVRFRSSSQGTHKEDQEEEEDEAHDHDHDHDHTISRAAHTDGINTVHFEVDADLDLVLLGEWLNQVVALYSRSHILRAKGIVSIHKDPRKCIVQCVLDTFTMAPATKWEVMEKKMSKIVIIGKNLERDMLEEGFRTCIVTNRESKKSSPTKRTVSNPTNISLTTTPTKSKLRARKKA